MIVLLILRGLAQIFFGGLRASEYEHLIEGTSLALTDTFLLIMILRSTIDRNITSPVFIMMIGKWTRWILRDRVDYIEGLANVPQSTAIKTTLVLFIVLITDSYCVIKYGLKLENFFTANLNSVFILEFFLGVVETVHLFFEYFLLAYDTMLEDPNFNKPLMQLYGNLIAVGSSLFAQTMFLLLLVKHMVFPIISLRTFTLNLRDFRKYLKNIVQSKRALKLMDTSFPDATIAEILENNTQCIICREELNNENDAAMNLEGPSGILFLFLISKNLISYSSKLNITKNEEILN
ncbi:MAG: E3 ubiquitin-protein ligase synoviolin [Paramarteilia canceri]